MYSYHDRISYSEVNQNQELNYYALVNYFQDCSCFHSDDVGVGLDFLTPRSMGWFVVNYEIHIVKMPKYLQRVSIATEPYGFKGIMGHRLYTITSDEGELLAYADSLWVLMDLKRNLPTRILPEMLNAYESSGETQKFEFEGCKLHEFDNAKTVGEFVVSEMYIDTNNHMNNSFYIDATRRFIPKSDFSSIKINYKKPAMYMDKLVVDVAEVDGIYQVILKKDNEIYTIVEYC